MVVMAERWVRRGGLVAIVALGATGTGRRARATSERHGHAARAHAAPRTSQAEARLASHARRKRRTRREQHSAFHTRWKTSSAIRRQRPAGAVN